MCDFTVVLIDEISHGFGSNGPRCLERFQNFFTRKSKVRWKREMQHDDLLSQQIRQLDFSINK